MSRQVQWTNQTETDLYEIWAYIAKDNQAAADRMVGRIMSHCDKLADHPRMGTPQERYRKDCAASWSANT